MFLRESVTRREGKTYRYWQLVESVRTAAGTRLRIVAHLGSLVGFTAEQWQSLAERLGKADIAEQLRRQVEGPRRKPGRPRKNLVFEPPEPGEQVLPIRTAAVSWEDPRDFGDVYVGLQMWKRSGLGQLIEDKLTLTQHKVPMDRIAALIAVARLVAPSSELKTARWAPTTALPELLGIQRALIDKDRLYRCLDLIWPLKATVEEHLQRDGQELFGQQYRTFLYDLSSTYFEGRAQGVPKAKRGYSRDHRPDCVQMCFGVVATLEGWPVGYETYEGNIRDHQTLQGLLGKLNARFGGPVAAVEGTDPARVLVMDRGLLTKENMMRLRQAHYGYLLAEKRARGAKWYWARGKEENWVVIRKDADDRPAVEVQEIGKDGPDRLILVRSAGCARKERGIHDRVLARLKKDLEAVRKTVSSGKLKDPQKIHKRLGRLEERHGSLWKWVRVQFLPGSNGEPAQLTWQVNADIEPAMRRAEGVYLLRTNLPQRSPKELWGDYMRLTVVEALFRTLKSDLHIRPIYHHKPDRVEAHLFFSFLAYVLYWLLEHEHRRRGGELTGRRLLEVLGQIKLGTIRLKTTGGQELRFKRVSSPGREIAEILQTLDVRLPHLGAEPSPMNLRREA